jgi:hypothetical protein
MVALRLTCDPTIARSGFGPVSAAGETLVVREWTDSGPSYLHIHRSDDEAWHVLEGTLRFRFEHGEVDAQPGPRSLSRLGWLIPTGSWDRAAT